MHRSIVYTGSTKPPLSLAARNGHPQDVKYLCEKNATAHGCDLNTAPLGAAAVAGHPEIVKYLVEKRHVPLNALARPFGATPLFVAASFLKLEVVRYLMEKGADPNIANAHGESAIGRVKRILEGQPTKPTPEGARLCNDLVACLGGQSVKARRASPPGGVEKGATRLLFHFIKPKKAWQFWQ